MNVLFTVSMTVIWDVMIVLRKTFCGYNLIFTLTVDEQNVFFISLYVIPYVA